MEWTEETIARLRDLWQQGLSTAEIGRQLSVTKNAVVGKAHRLGLKPRPSPIRRGAKAEKAADKAAQAPAASAPAAQPAVVEVSVAAVSVAVASAPVASSAPAAPAAAAQEEARPAPKAPRKVTPTRAERAAAARAAANPPRRRSSQSCCWPLGDPGTPGFHFCGATPLPGKPYCAEHAQLAYVKLRDRRDNVA
ncbi:GcrA family cell cycle regulator [Novacetimonas maltaceti]